MALFWFNSGISDEDRARLIELYYELGGEAFVWPRDDYAVKRGEAPLVKVPLHIESTEEIDRIIRWGPHYGRRPPG